MIPQYDHALLCSCFNWVQNRFQNKLQAYINQTTPLYYTPDNELPPQWLGYSGPVKNWIYDSGVSGAWIIQSVSGGGFSAPLTRASGINIDYVNSRVIVPSGFGKAMALTGAVAVAEVNLYMVNEYEDPLLTQDKMFFNPRFVYPATSGIPPYVLATPAMFLNTLVDENEAFALGGLNNCRSTLSLTILAESNYQLNALLSTYRDARYDFFPLIPITQDPINQFGDTKSGFNYNNLIAQYGTPGNLVYIENVHTSKISDRVKMNVGLFAGVVDFDLSYVRQTT